MEQLEPIFQALVKALKEKERTAGATQENHTA